MSFVPRLRLPRRRQPLLSYESDAHDWYLFTPPPDEPLHVLEFGDAVALATDLPEVLPVQHEALVLLDEQRRVTSVLIDPPAEVGLFVGHADLPGMETPFCQTLSVVLQPRVRTGPPSSSDRHGYHAFRRMHMAQGLLLLDVLLTDGDAVRSLAIGCDPDPVWFEEFPATA